LGEGDKVKVTVRFRGRERERPEFGRKLIDRMLEELGESAVLEQDAEFTNRDMSVVLAPSRKRRTDRKQVSDVDTPEKDEVEVESEEE
jgi:translation initiation factor IF-3